MVENPLLSPHGPWPFSSSTTHATAKPLCQAEKDSGEAESKKLGNKCNVKATYRKKYGALTVCLFYDAKVNAIEQMQSDANFVLGGRYCAKRKKV